MYLDGKLYYRHVLDSIHFDVARYVNTYADYDLKKQKGITIQKLFKSKNNDLPIYKTIHDKGFISFNDEAPHAIRIIAYDFYNQKDEVSFTLRIKKTLMFSISDNKKQNCLKPYKDSTKEYCVELPAKSLYEDVQLVTSYQNNILSFTAKNYDIPFQNNCTITLKVPQALLKYNDKLCIADVTNGGKSYVGGTFENGNIKASTKTFGKYKVDLDTIAPQVKLITQKKSGVYKNGDIISFKVNDAFSGI